MRHLHVTRVDAVRGVVAGSASTSLRQAALALFEAGGRRLLPAGVQRAVRSAVEREAAQVLTGTGLLTGGVGVAGRLLERSGGARAVALHGAKAAGRQVFRSLSMAAGAGAVVDGGWALFQTMGKVREGTMTRQEAGVRVAREAATGAASTVAGAAAATLLVAVTGGMAAPAVFLVGAAVSLGAKTGLDAWLRTRAQGAIRVAREEAAAACAP